MTDPEHDTTPKDMREETLGDHGTDAFPETLRIEVSEDDTLDRLRERTDRLEAGEEFPATRVFQPDTLRQVLTPRRLELIETIMADPPESISALSERMDRTYSVVHDDLELLADHGIVVFERAGRARRPVVPYDRIEYSGIITGERATA